MLFLNSFPHSPAVHSNGPYRWEVCANLISLLWRSLLDSLNLLLAPAAAEPLFLSLLRAYQAFAYAAGALRVPKARDGFLTSLCQYTLLAPDDPAWLQAEQAAAGNAGKWLCRVFCSSRRAC